MKITPHLAILLAFGISPLVCAAEATVSCKTLPPSVLEEGKKQLDGGTVKSCVKDREKGVTTYEVELVKDGKSKDVTLDTSGKILSIEEEVEMSSLPAPVKDAFQKAAGSCKMGKIESLTKDGVVVSYEATIIGKGRHREIAAHPDGTMFKPD